MAANDADDSLPPGWRVEFRARKNGRKEKVLIERAEPEGLPPGWIKEVKVRKSAHKVRRDAFYIDPVSGYTFCSMKDVLRYLATGELGRLAFKPKDKDSHDDQDSENDNDHSPTAAKKPKIATETHVTGQSTKPDEIAKDEDVADGRENIPLSEPTTNHGGAGAELSGSNLPKAKDSSKVDEGKDSDKSVCLGAGAELSGSNLPEAKDSSKVEEGKDSDKSVCLSTPSVLAVLDDRQTSESGDIEDATKKSKLGSKSRKKKVFDLPRRSSKRLAGVELDPTPELKTGTRARQAVVKQSGAEVPGTVGSSKSTKDSQESSKSKHHSEDLANPNEKAKVETGWEAEAKPKPGPPFDLPFGDLLLDPCIAFAFKTLTGDSFEASNGIGVSAREENDGDQTQNLAIPVPGEHAVNVAGNSCKTDEKPGSSLDSSPFADILTDPCIEFAIKTLTGSIPVGCDQDTAQQQLNTSQTQSAKNFCQTELLKPASREQARSRNLSIQKSGGATGLRQPGENRFNECH